MNFNNLMDVMIPIFFSDRWEQIFNFLVCFNRFCQVIVMYKGGNFSRWGGGGGEGDLKEVWLGLCC